MTNLHIPKLVMRVTIVVLLLSMALATSPAMAARDRIPPTTPTNLHVTATTSYSVSLAWNPSTDNSGKFSYVIRASNGRSASLPQTVTSFTFTAGLEPRYSYSFYIYAVDAAGNKSKNSNTVSATLPADTTPPTAPVLSVSDVGPTHVSLTWTASIDDGPYVWYQVYLNGSPYGFVDGANTTSTTISNLTPETTYTFAVRARDFGQNLSPLSNSVTATTQASDPNDATPPTTPGNLRDNGMLFGEEVWLFWDESTDNVTPQEFIRYDVYDNGDLVGSTVGYAQFVFYLTPGIINEVSVYAVDAAGNASVPATVTYDLR
jgi:chitodextrinase